MNSGMPRRQRINIRVMLSFADFSDQFADLAEAQSNPTAGSVPTMIVNKLFQTRQNLEQNPTARAADRELAKMITALGALLLLDIAVTTGDRSLMARAQQFGWR